MFLRVFRTYHVCGQQMILRVLSTYHVGEKQMFLRVFRTVSRRQATTVYFKYLWVREEGRFKHTFSIILGKNGN